MTALFPEGYQERDPNQTQVERAVGGVTTTTTADAVAGAEKGAGIGLGLGALAAIASLIVPGFGVVTSGGALVTALMGVAATTIGGALTGSAAGYLQDQGVPYRVALDVEETLKNGSAIVVVDCPTGKLEEAEVTEIVSKYHAKLLGYVEEPVAKTS